MPIRLNINVNQKVAFDRQLEGRALLDLALRGGAMDAAGR